MCSDCIENNALSQVPALCSDQELNEERYLSMSRGMLTSGSAGYETEASRRSESLSSNIICSFSSTRHTTKPGPAPSLGEREDHQASRPAISHSYCIHKKEGGEKREGERERSRELIKSCRIDCKGEGNRWQSFESELAWKAKAEERKGGGGGYSRANLRERWNLQWRI